MTTIQPERTGAWVQSGRCGPSRGRQGGRSRSRAGFGLLELLISLTVLLVVMAGSGLSYVTSHDLARAARETSLATEELGTAMEELLAQTRANLVDPAGDYVAGQPIPAYEGRLLDAERVVPTYPGHVPGDPAPPVLDIRLTITWTGFDSRERSLTIASSTSQ